MFGGYGHINPDTGGESIKCDFVESTGRTIIDELALRLGDAVHNLKCALDHAWYQTVTRLISGRNWERAKFPVYPTPDILKKALEALEINISTPNLFNFIVSKIQPYNGGNIAIRSIHTLNIRDKHKLLIPVLHYSSIGDIYVKDQEGKIHKGGTWGTTKPLPHFVDFERGLHVENPGSATVEILFEYGNPRQTMSMVETLRFYSHHVSVIVKLLENFEE